MSGLRCDGTSIWNAGVDAVRPKPLVQRTIHLERDELRIGDLTWKKSDLDRVLVVGAGKAGTGMAEGLLQSLQGWLPITGWVNVPEGTEKTLPGIQIHAARPAGVNEPTEQGVAGTREIIKLVRSAGPRDLCIALISGGGSALLPAPKPGITLEDKIEATRFLSAAGADITELNTVRKQLSEVKGGGLLRACLKGNLVTLILSDVLGDPLDLIASGPTVESTSGPQQALDVLRRFDPDRSLPNRLYDLLAHETTNQNQTGGDEQNPVGNIHSTFVIGNNALAVDEAGLRAEQLGYNHVMQSATKCEGAAEQVGRHMAKMTLLMLTANSPTHRNDCLITGGEPTVKLVPEAMRGQGGRNQQLVLAAYSHLLDEGIADRFWEKLCLLSGGTDGEDGPTDAAGAILDQQVHARASELALDPNDYLKRNDAYAFFAQCDGLLKTGPTGTNVCDLRVAVLAQES